MRNARALHHHLYVLGGSFICCLLICVLCPLFPSCHLAPAFRELVLNGQHIPAMSTWFMDPATRLLVTFFAAPAMSAYAGIVQLDERKTVRGGRCAACFRTLGCFAMSAGGTGIVVWADSLQEAQSVEAVKGFLAPHVACAILLFAGIVLLGFAHPDVRVTRWASATFLLSVLYGLLSYFSATSAYAAVAEYFAGGAALATLWRAADAAESATSG